jgi:4-hydroxy-4-methyl-2-oxoglutarate aldolase
MKLTLCAFVVLAGTVCGQVKLNELSDAELAKGVQLIQFGDYGAEDPMELVKKYEGLRVTDVVDAMQAIGLQDVGSMDNSIHPLWKDTTEKLTHRVYGVAVTAQFVPTQRPGSQTGTDYEDFRKWHNYWYGNYAQGTFNKLLKPGTVLVIDAHDVTNVGYCGSNNSLDWHNRGMAGIVTNGGCRDTDELILQKIPAYLKYTSHGTRPGRIELSAINTPVSVGGALVRPWDFVVADGDGVVVVPREHAEKVAEIAWDIANGDKKGRRKLYEDSGMKLDETVK